MAAVDFFLKKGRLYFHGVSILFLFQGGVAAEIERKTIVLSFHNIFYLFHVYTHLRLEK